MLEAASPVIASLWATAFSWFTPTVLFLLLNLVIATIAITSSRGPHNSDASAAASGFHKLSRSPSLVLERLKSFNLYSYRPTETPTVTLEPSEPEPEPEPEEHHISRSQSDTKPAAGEIPTKLAKKMKKSATVKSAFNHFEYEEIPRRPATMRERELKEEDAEVDERADDFINRFKQQLKLQRLESLIRYKEMINRGI